MLFRLRILIESHSPLDEERASFPYVDASDAAHRAGEVQGNRPGAALGHLVMGVCLALQSEA
jgi:hypothetical protein